MAWVEERKAPDAVVATGVSFKTAPTTRSRPLCPYPQTLRYTGPKVGDIALAEKNIALAENYTCREWPTRGRGRGDRDDDDDD
jgi:hypothetical protein